MNDWRESTLAEVCVKPMYGAIAKGSQDPIGPRFVRQTDLVDGRINWASVPFCDLPEADFGKYKVDRDDILVARLGSVGRSARVRDDTSAVFAGYLVRFRARPEMADARFLAYQLLTDDWWNHVEAVRSGAVQATLNAQQMGAFRFLLPPIDEQRRIAGVLGALDDAIEMNRRLVDDHWAAAEIAFEHASRGGEPSTLGTVLTLRYGKSLPATTRVPGPYPVVSSAGITGSHTSALASGPGVVVGRKGTVGSVTWVFEDFFPIDTAFYVETKLPMLFAYFALRGAGLSHMNTDSAVPGLNRDNALQRPIAVPTGDVLADFKRVTDALMDAVRELEAEIADLTDARGALLSLLMSGRVRVDDVEAAA